MGKADSRRQYGTHTMVGTEWTDEICVTESACVEDFEFFLVKDQDAWQNLGEKVDGILGLSRDHPHFLASEKGNKRGPSYMKAMENAELISENTFSFFMRPFEKDSAVDFGKPKSSRMKDSDDLVTFELNKDFFWSAYCKGFAVNTTDNGWSWGSVKDYEETVTKNSIYSMFDTGSSQIYVPQHYFKNFLKEIYSTMKDDEYELADGYVVTKCYEDFPPVHFLFGDYWITVDPKHYVVDISEKQNGSMCVLLFGQGDHPFLVMGLPAYMDYYVIHSERDETIGFAPHNYSKKPAPEEGEQPGRVFMSTTPPDKPISIWTWIVTIILALAVPAFFVTAILRAGSKDKTPGQKGGRYWEMETSTLIIWISVAVVCTGLWVWLMFAWFFGWFNDAIVDTPEASLEQKMLVAGSGIALFTYFVKKDESKN